MISLHEHLEQVKHQNHYLMKVIEHEKNNIVRLSNEFKKEFNELVSQLVSEGVENIENKIKVASICITWKAGKKKRLTATSNAKLRRTSK